MNEYDLAVVGGGASGLFAALRASEQGCRVLILEAADRVGKKLITTGNGQGNVTSALPLSPSRYHGKDPAFCLPALNAFDNERAREVFRALGLLTVAEDERVFPLSKQAGSLVDVLRFALETRGVTVRTGVGVTRAVRQKNGFLIHARSGETFSARALLLATGGKCAPTSPDYGAGYEIARAFGHTITPLFPSLVQLRADMKEARVLKGIRADVRLTLSDPDRVYFSQIGEILFCDYGISGKIVFAGSSYVADRSFRNLTAHVDFFPDFSRAELENLLAERAAAFPALPTERLLLGAAKSQVARAVLGRAALVPKTIGELSPDERARTVSVCKDFSLPLLGAYSFDTAQVTRGGIETKDVDPFTMMSKKCPDLYFSGEILDVDGDCGGFNLQWCWSSAEAVAKSVAGGRA